MKVADTIPPANAQAANIGTARADSVRDFSRTNNLDEFLRIAQELAEECFSPDAIECELMRDDETEDAWLIVRVRVKDSPENVLAAKKRYTREWIARVPWPQRHMIRLSYDIND